MKKNKIRKYLKKTKKDFFDFFSKFFDLFVNLLFIYVIGIIITFFHVYTVLSPYQRIMISIKWPVYIFKNYIQSNY
jgi:hypothetical protein